MLLTLILLALPDTYWSGIEKYERGDWAGAVADFTAALKQSPGHAGTLARRGLARLHTKDKAANADFDAALEADAKNVYAQLGRGLAKKDPAQLCAALAELAKSTQDAKLADEAREALSSVKLVSVKITDGGANKYDVIKEVRGIAGNDVESAKQMVAGKEPVIEGICPDQAKAMQKTLEGVGAKATLD